MLAKQLLKKILHLNTVTETSDVSPTIQPYRMRFVFWAADKQQLKETL